MLVFAYGSNLDPHQMQQRCPSSKALGAAVLDDFTLAFAGRSSLWENGAVATIKRCDLGSTGQVLGAVYSVPDLADMRNLDACEGVPHSYIRVPLTVRLNGRAVIAETYIKADASWGEPSRRYVETIVRGYKHHGLDAEPLQRMLSRSHVFVYGSLRRGFHNHRAHLGHDGATFVCEDLIDGFAMHSLGGFPGIVPGEDLIFGETYEVDARTMRMLDALEGHPHFYARQKVLTGEGYEAWVYVLTNRNNSMLGAYIETGDWRDHAEVQRLQGRLSFYRDLEDWRRVDTVELEFEEVEDDLDWAQWPLFDD